MWCLEVIKKMNEPPISGKICDVCLKRSDHTSVITTTTLSGIVLCFDCKRKYKKHIPNDPQQRGVFFLTNPAWVNTGFFPIEVT